MSYLAGVFVLAVIMYFPFKQEKYKELTPDQKEIYRLQAEIDNLHYQLNQCKILYRGL